MRKAIVLIILCFLVPFIIALAVSYSIENLPPPISAVVSTNSNNIVEPPASAVVSTDSKNMIEPSTSAVISTDSKNMIEPSLSASLLTGTNKFYSLMTVEIRYNYSAEIAISFSDHTFTYNYDGYSISAIGNNADSCLFNGSAYDSYTTVNSTAKQFYKTVKLPAGNFKINATVTGAAGAVTKVANVVINKATPTLSLSCPSSSPWFSIWINTTENNKGDNDLSYRTFLNGELLGSTGSFNIQRPSGTYTVVFNASGGQNYTASSKTCSIIVTKAWEKTNNVRPNETMRYDMGKYDVPIKAFQQIKPVDSTIYVGREVNAEIEIDVTNVDSIVGSTFANVIVDAAVPQGWRNKTNTNLIVSSLAPHETKILKVGISTMAVVEKAVDLSQGRAVYTIFVNDSLIAPYLPVIYTLKEPPSWANRTSYTISVDGKTKGFTFDPQTLTLYIPTTFSNSSLDPGDHTIELLYTTGATSSSSTSQGSTSGSSTSNTIPASTSQGSHKSSAIFLPSILTTDVLMLSIALVIAGLILMRKGSAIAGLVAILAGFLLMSKGLPTEQIIAIMLVIVLVLVIYRLKKG